MYTKQIKRNFHNCNVKYNLHLAWLPDRYSGSWSQGPEEMCLSLEHQNPSKTSEKMGYFDRVTVSLHIL